MSTIIDTINSLSNLLPLKSPSTKEIEAAELQLRLYFANDYKDYLANFGAIIADGIELTGITKSEYRNVTSVTLQEWKLNSNIPHTMYVIEQTGIDGIIIWQDSNGIVYQSSPNTKPKQICKSLNDYIKSYHM